MAKSIAPQTTANKVDQLGYSRLGGAARCGQLKKVQRELDAGADPNIGSYHRVTPLWNAAFHGHVAVVQLLLERGADPNLADGDRQSPLKVATENAGRKDADRDSLAIVELLLRHGADPDQADGGGVTPRDLARSKTRSLFDAIKRRVVKRPVPMAPTPGQFAGPKDDGYYWNVHARLWRQLVPASGQAPTVQGEIIRIVGTLTDEAYIHHNANWGPSCTRMWKFVARTLDDPKTFTGEERKRIKTWIGWMIGWPEDPDLTGEGCTHYLVAEMAVAWVLAHPKAIRHTPDPRVTM